jgi:hypothetical protein
MQCTIRLPVRLLVAPVLAAALAPPILAAGQAAPTGQPYVVVVQVESKEKRLHYLATAQIWADPGDLTPQALLAGPPLADGSGVEAALDGRPFPCTFAKPGKSMGGKHAEVRLHHGHRHDDSREVQRPVEEEQPGSLCRARGVAPPVGAGVQYVSDVPAHARLQGLP